LEQRIARACESINQTCYRHQPHLRKHHRTSDLETLASSKVGSERPRPTGEVKDQVAQRPGHGSNGCNNWLPRRKSRGSARRIRSPLCLPIERLPLSTAAERIDGALFDVRNYPESVRIPADGVVDREAANWREKLIHCTRFVWPASRPTLVRLE